MIVIGLSCSRIETRRLYSFLKKDKKISVDFESDIKKISWYDSENLVMERIDHLENKLYKNTNNNSKHSIFAEVSFYLLPYFELIVKNYPYLKFVCTVKSRKKTQKDILDDYINEKNFFMRILTWKKKFKNHLVEHDGKKWQKDYLIDKCYPKFKSDNLEESINQYIDTYYTKIKHFEKKYPKNLQVFYADELKSKYGRKKIYKFINS